MNKKSLWALAFVLVAIVTFTAGTSYTFAQPEEEEEEPVQARPNPLENNSKTMNFIKSHFGSFSIKGIKALKAGKTLKMTAKKAFKLSSGFSMKKGQTMLIGTTKTGLKIRSLKKGDRGIILQNKLQNKGLSIKNLNNNKALMDTFPTHMTNNKKLNQPTMLKKLNQPTMNKGMMH